MSGGPAPRSGGGPTIADVVEVVPVDTVVRLDGRRGRLSELVLTGDVAASLRAVLEAASGSGGAFFLVGHFGSGKSHLLAALAELIGQEIPDRELPTGWGPDISGATRSLPPGLAIAVPLVEHRSGAVLEDVVVARTRAALGTPAASPDPAPETSEKGTDRRATWEALQAGWTAAGYGTVLIALDELSEFLRAKRGPALVEDLRFLQFLGEWAPGHSVTVVAALQESIEEVANVSQRELGRIRDRYRTLGLSMRHVEDLVRGRLLRLRPGGDELIDRAYQAIRKAFPGWDVPQDRFARCYPVHPATLSLLEGLRFVFSQQRGVVDFLCRQMLGDAPAGIEPWADRGYTELLTPDRIFDHFRQRLAERSETRRFTEAVVPYWERAVGEVFDGPGDAGLALRAIKVLALLAASPLERPRTGRELAHLLLQRVSSIDPETNVTYLEREVLQPLAARGAYVVAKAASPGSPPAYSVELEANAAEVALTRTRQARAELASGDRRVVRSLVALGSTPSLPLEALAASGAAVRDVLWHRTHRRLLTVLTRVPELTVDDARRFVEQARAVDAEGVFVIGEAELGSEMATGPGSADRLGDHARSLAGSVERLAIWVPSPLTPGEEEAALEIQARRMVLAQSKAEGNATLVEMLRRMTDNDAARAGEMLRRAYFGGTVAVAGAGTPGDLQALAGLPFERVLANLADALLGAIHPRHREIAPRDEALGSRSMHRLIKEVIPQLPIGLAAAERGQLRPLIEGHLKPLGLARRTVDAWAIAPDAARSPAVAEALRLVGESGDGAGASGPAVLKALADGPFGLTEDEALLVLNACAHAGLLEIRRGKTPLGVPYDEVQPGDVLAPGELVDPAVREALGSLASLMNLPELNPWNAGVQTAAWERARVWVGLRRIDAGHVREGLADLTQNPAFAGADTAELEHDLALLTDAVVTCDVDAQPIAGLRAVAELAGDAPALKAAAPRIAAAAGFFREGYPRVAQALAYLDLPDLNVPPEATQLLALREKAHRLVPDLPALAMNDRGGELLDTLTEFRRRYVASYRDAHQRFHQASGTANAAAFRAGAPYRALAALARIPAISVPHDKIAVDRALAAIAPAPCTRHVESELLWRARCSCGFALGDTAPEADLDAVAALARQGVAEHLAELGRPEHRSRLEGAVADLESLGNEALASELGRLLGFTDEPDTAQHQALAELLGGGAGLVVQDVLAGGQVVVRRDLSTLRDDLAGRRYPKRRLLELLAAWVDPGGELAPGSYVEVLDEPDWGDATRGEAPADSPDR